ncbi:ATP-binding protein [uncultured Imperialibacter sp.]|uniref:ATP-binding protein n=1 Tax=uncultured Imperialibacter sp. TaxID=1672639 RepID=UPI0030D92368|tara:strand:+ start:6031 stop:7830 length:1800 start_codon:yes stop_codon:yes gene_type:complete
MSSQTYTTIGHVKSVNGSRLSIKLSDDIKSSIPIIDGVVYRVGQIGSFVRIPLGYANLYGIVTQAGAEAIPEKLIGISSASDNLMSSRWITVVLVGERIRDRFERGVIQYPTPEDEVHLVTIDDLKIIYSQINKDSSLTVGQISASESLPAHIDLDKFTSRHCAIVGSTGSGKSNTVSIILEAIASNKKFKSSRILLIDPHGEYNETLRTYSKVYRIGADTKNDENELSIPFWALPFNELFSIFPGALKESALESIRAMVYERKVEAAKLLDKKPLEQSISADSPIPFSLNKLWFELDDFEKQVFNKEKVGSDFELKLVDRIENGDPSNLKPSKHHPPAPGGGNPNINKGAMGILSYLNGIRNRLMDDRYNFLFNPGAYKPNLTGKATKDLHLLLAEWLNHDKPITILDLSGVPSEIMSSISGTIIKIIYDSLFWGQELNVGGRKQPILLALEEAHSYLKAGENSISSRIVQTIAKEGRKYGVGLLLITQRPSELDETVLSQLGSLIALRMTNSKDRGHVGSVMPDDLNDLVSLLPSLRTGEGLIMGESVKIPSRVRFDKIAYAPKSSDPLISEQWILDKPDSKEYEDLILRWRNRKFK